MVQGIDALMRSDGGADCVPASPSDWADWVSPSRLRNYMLGDPILDWLGMYGEAKGYTRDQAEPLTDLLTFLLDKGVEFEARVVAHLGAKADVQVASVARTAADHRSIDKARETFELMGSGAKIIHGGVLRNPETRTYGAPDLLIRSDVLERLFPDAITAAEAATPAPVIPGSAWHYRVVDVKFSTLGLNAAWHLGNGGSAPAYKAQLAVYAAALSRLQGLAQPVAYLLGRGWRKGYGDTERRCDRYDDRLAPVDTAADERARLMPAACDWVRRLRTEGASWEAEPRPTVDELFPNMSFSEDAPWHGAKKRIAESIGEVTQLWQVGIAKRPIAHRNGVKDWRAPGVTSAALGVTGDTTGPRLQAILDINHAEDGSPVAPAVVEADRDAWYPRPDVEFYVDFETVSNLDDQFDRLPEKAGQPLIFMVGCGHVENGAWQFRCFIADALTVEEEASTLDRWFGHMEEVRQRLAPDLAQPHVFHWSHAETTSLSGDMASAEERHRDRVWPKIGWFDLLARVARTNHPLVVRGAFGFGLKSIAKAMNAHGLIETTWTNGPTDGLGAMVGAWSCAKAAREQGKTLTGPIDLDYHSPQGIPPSECPDIAAIQNDLMREIACYNEVDCKVMWEILEYLRKHH